MNSKARTGASKSQGKKVLSFNVILLSLISILAVSCGGGTPVPVVSTSTPETPTSLPEPTQTAGPTLTPTPDAQQQAEAAFFEEVYTLMKHFDDGDKLVNSYYPQGMLAGEYDALSEDDKALLQQQKMRDQAFAVLTYIKIGKMEDAKRILTGLWTLINSDFDMASYINENGGGRSMVWWNIACQQYFLLTGDKDVVELMQWLGWKGLDGLPSGFDPGYGRRIVGENPDFWENEHTIQQLTSALLKLKILENFAPQDAYGWNDPSYDMGGDVTRTFSRLSELSQHLRDTLYQPGNGDFYPGFNTLDTYALAIQILCIMESDYPDLFINAQTDIHELIKYTENNFATTLTENGKTYSNLYRAANEENIPVSFEASLQVAIAYAMAGDIYESRITDSERTQNYIDAGLTFVEGNLNEAEALRQQSRDIVDSVLAYTKVSGFDSIPYASENALLFKQHGWSVYRAPAMSTLAQWVQVNQGTFLKPTLPTGKVEVTSSKTDVFTRQLDDGTSQEYRFYAAYRPNDSALDDVCIALANYSISYLIQSTSEDGQRVNKLYIIRDDPRFEETGLEWPQ